MKHRFVVCRLLFPADENPPEAVYPRCNTLDHPSSRAAATSAFRRLFLAARLDVGTIAASASFMSKRGRVIPLVAAKMLRTTRRWARSANGKVIERGAKEPLVMRIRAGDCYTQRHASTIGQHRPLDAQLAPIGRIFPGFFPRPREPWWSSHRDFATSIGCLGGHHTVAADTSRACGTDDVAPIPESNGAANCRSRIPAALPSIGNQFAGRRKYRRRLSAVPAVADLPMRTCDSGARTTPCASTDRREYANSDKFVQRAYENPP